MKQKVNEIIEYFEKNLRLINGQHAKGVDEKNYHTNKKMMMTNLTLTTFIVFLSVLGLAVGSFNSLPQFVDMGTGVCNADDLNYFNNSNLTAACLETLKQEPSLASDLIETNGSMVDILLAVFLIMAIVILWNIISGIRLEYKQYKRLDELNNERILIEDIILSLYSLKINFSDKLRTNKVKEIVMLFDKKLAIWDQENNLEIFCRHTKELICDLQEKKRKALLQKVKKKDKS